ncbi:MAG: hypothetical protein U0359_35840 [Byssovorax sp.]
MTRFVLAVPALFFAVGCGFAVEGCSVLLSPNEVQCETATDCKDRGFSDALCVNQICVDPLTADPTWGCLGRVTEPEPDPTQKVEFSMRLVFAIGGAPVTTAKVDFCDKLDVECTSANPDFPKNLSTDADGNLKINVVQGFDGFVRLTDPKAIVDSRIYVGRPIVKPPKVKEIQLLRPGEPELLAKTAKKTIDPMRGMAILLGTACNLDAVGGLRFECPAADDKSDQFYLINQSPTLPPEATQTDADGFGGYFNLPPGQTLARSIRVDGDVYVGQSSFLVLASTISYVQISPTPQ